LLEEERERKRQLRKQKEQEALAEETRIEREEERQERARARQATLKAQRAENGGYTNFQLFRYGVVIMVIPLSILGLLAYLLLGR
jgi:hypothetical protein